MSYYHSLSYANKTGMPIMYAIVEKQSVPFHWKLLNLMLAASALFIFGFLNVFPKEYKQAIIWVSIISFVAVHILLMAIAPKNYQQIGSLELTEDAFLIHTGNHGEHPPEKILFSELIRITIRPRSNEDDTPSVFAIEWYYRNGSQRTLDCNARAIRGKFPFFDGMLEDVKTYIKINNPPAQILMLAVAWLIFLFLRNRIVPMSAPRMTPGDSARSEPQSFQRSMNANRFDHICGTGWIVATGIGQYRADQPLVQLDWNNEQKTEKLSQQTHTQRYGIVTNRMLKRSSALVFPPFLCNLCNQNPC